MLAERFISRAAKKLREPERVSADGGSNLLDGVEAMLLRIRQRVTRACPEVGVNFDDFALHLADRIPEGEAPAAAERLFVEDLYIAYGCICADEGAVRAFEQRCMVSVDQYLSNSKDYRRYADEIRQRVLVRVLVGTIAGEPKMSRYAGTGPLAAWLRTMTVRVAVDALRHHDKARPPKLLPESMPAIDPEVLYLKNRYREESEAALRAAIAALDAKSTSVLKYYYFESMSSEAIGRIYSVSSRTVQRWLAEGHKQVVREFRKSLRTSLDLSATQLDSLVGLVQSQLGATVRHCFETELEGQGSTSGKVSEV